MKRTLLTATALYLLYDRQKRVEARTKAWQSRLEDDLRRWLTENNREISRLLERLTTEISDLLVHAGVAERPRARRPRAEERASRAEGER